MKTAFFLVLFVALLLVFLFGAGWFYNWAWATEPIPGGLRLVRPVAAGIGLLLLMLGGSFAFGPLLAIPLHNLGVFK